MSERLEVLGRSTQGATGTTARVRYTTHQTEAQAGLAEVVRVPGTSNAATVGWRVSRHEHEWLLPSQPASGNEHSEPLVGPEYRPRRPVVRARYGNALPPVPPVRGWRRPGNVRRIGPLKVHRSSYNLSRKGTNVIGRSSLLCCAVSPSRWVAIAVGGRSVLGRPS